MRSSPMPVSIEGLGRSTRSPGAALLVLHEHEVPELEEAVAVLRPALPGGPPATLSPWSKKISEQGPHGPVSPADQKLSEVAMRMILSSAKPVTFFQMR